MKIRKLLSRFDVSKLVVLLGFSFVFGLGQAAMIVRAQGEAKLVKLAYAVNPQLKFADLKAAGQDSKFNESFKAGSDWLEKLSFKLENSSGKTIVYLQVNLNFPETRATGNLMSYALSFGLRPDSKLKVTNPNAPFSLKSGEKIEISLAEQKDKIYKFVSQRQPFASLQEAELEIGFVVFEDKTAWNAGAFLRQDSENPDRYLPIGKESPK